MTVEQSTQPATPAPLTRRRRARKFWYTRVRPAWQDYRWPVLIVLAGIALFLGYIGWDWHFDATGRDRSFWDKAYASLQLFVLESGSANPPIPWPLQIARLLAPAVGFYAALSALVAIFRNQFARLGVRLFASDHVLVCGLGRIGVLVAKGFHDLGYKVVAIEEDEENNAIEECREEGIAVVVGDATDRTLLRKARLAEARYLLAVCGSDELNVSVAIHAGELGEERKGRPLECFVHVLDPDLLSLLTESGIGTAEGDHLRLEAFNTSDRGAPALLEQYPVFADDRGPRAPKTHLLVVGLGQMGSRLLVQAAREWRQTFGKGARRMKVTVVDRKATEKVASLSQRYPQLKKVCRFVLRDIDVDSPAFRRADFLLDPKGHPGITAAYVCLGDDVRGLSAGALLRRRLRDRSVPIVVRTTERGGATTLMGRSVGGPLAGLDVFGLLDLVCRPEVLLRGPTEILARAIHEEYLRAQRRARQTPETNPAMVGWEDLPEDLKESNRRQADDIRDKLQVVGCVIEPLTDWDAPPIEFTQSEVELLGRKEHDRWWREREADGWTPGPEKDIERKKSPYLIRWEELTEEVREWDRVTVRELPAFLASIGFAVVRVKQEVSNA